MDFMSTVNLALCAACHASAKAGGKIVSVKD